MIVRCEATPYWNRSGRLMLLLGLFLSITTCSSSAGIGQEQEPAAVESGLRDSEKVIVMTAAQIVELIKRKDWTITELPIQIDQRVTPELIALCKDPDPEVREITLHALSAADGQEARACILRALHDEDINVRSAAVGFLRDHASTTDLRQLHAELSGNTDELVREEVALTLGKIGEAGSIASIKQHSANESDPDAAHAMHLALVRLRDDENRKVYMENFRDADPKIRVKALQDFEYIQDRTYLPTIAPLLFDEEPGLDIGPSNKKIFIRVCDVAVNVLDEVLNHPFGFSVDEYKNYTREELQQAAETVQRMQ